MLSFFMCLKDEVKHTVSRQELPLQVLETRPLRKFGYAVLAEVDDGDHAEVLAVLPDRVVLCRGGELFSASLH